MLPADAPPDFAGTRRFQIIRRLGAGGMGIVYEAFDRERNARVALKTLRTMSAEELFALKNEFRSLQDVSHPNLVSLGELIEDDARWFFTMELVDGQDVLRYVRGDAGGITQDASTMSISNLSLDDTLPPPRLARAREFDEHRLRTSLVQLALGLNALHAARKVHRDIKPANVLVAPGGRVVVLDFGLAFDTQREGGWEPRFAGTVGYMAPELFTSGTIGQAGDWYATGVLMFEALAGRQPFDAPNRLALMEAQQQDGPAPSTMVDGVPADLDELCHALLRRDPERRPDGDEVLRRLGHRGSPRISSLSRSAPFIGRGAEMAKLDRAREQMRLGAVTVRVRGESGVGKSFLVRQFTSKLIAHDAETVVFNGRCYERESVPYKALDGVVDELTRFLGASLAHELPDFIPPGFHALAQVFPVLRQIVTAARTPAPTEKVEPQVLRAQASAALREILRRIASRRPLVLVIDDLHWTDADSLQLLRELLRPPLAPRLLLLLTLRDGDLGQVPQAEADAAVPASSPDFDLRLGALTEGDAEQLVAQLVGSVSTSEVDVRSIAREAGGHPMFIHELVQHVALWSDDSKPELVRIDDAIRARVGRLDEGSRTIMELVALAGKPLAQDAIARASGLDFDEFSQLATSLRVSNLVRTRGARPSDPIEPVHDRVREAVIGALDSDHRVVLHERLAGVLETATAADPETLAVHWRGAGNIAQALRYAVLAAEQATTAVAFRRAARLYRMALELGPTSPAQRRELLTKVGESLANAGDGGAAADAYLSAATDAPLEERVELERRAADQLLRAGHIDRGIEQMRRVLGRVGMALPSTPGRALASVLYRRARVRLRGLRFTPRAASEVPPQELALVDICWSLASLGLIDTIRGADFGARQLLLALNVGEPNRLARALAIEAVYAAQMSGPARARMLLAEATRLAETDALPHVLGIVATTTGLVEYVFGNYEVARSHCERGHQYFSACLGAAWEISVTHLFTTICLFLEGRLAELARRLPPILVEADDRGDLFTATSIRLATEHVVLVAAGRTDDARANVADALSRWSQTGFQMQHRYALVTNVEIDLAGGRAREAYDRIEARWREIESSMLLQIRQQRIDTYGARGRAAVAAALAASGSERKRLLAEAARHAKRIIGEDLTWSIGSGKLVTAAIARARGDDAAAVADLKDALAKFEATGMALHAATTRRRLGEVLGGDEGRALVARAAEWMVAAGVENPDGLVRMLAPGFGAT
jgi:eukaryotic-like serine/threonine-protein kinase